MVVCGMIIFSSVDGWSPYISEPGVVRVWPLSSQVFSPDKIIGQPP